MDTGSTNTDISVEVFLTEKKLEALRQEIKVIAQDPLAKKKKKTMKKLEKKAKKLAKELEKMRDWRDTLFIRQATVVSVLLKRYIEVRKYSWLGDGLTEKKVDC